MLRHVSSRAARASALRPVGPAGCEHQLAIVEIMPRMALVPLAAAHSQQFEKSCLASFLDRQDCSNSCDLTISDMAVDSVWTALAVLAVCRCMERRVLLLSNLLRKWNAWMTEAARRLGMLHRDASCTAGQVVMLRRCCKAISLSVRARMMCH